MRGSIESTSGLKGCGSASCHATVCALKHDAHDYVQVPSEENISDLPSKFQHELLQQIGAKKCEPVLSDMLYGREDVLDHPVEIELDDEEDLL